MINKFRTFHAWLLGGGLMATILNMAIAFHLLDGLTILVGPIEVTLFVTLIGAVLLIEKMCMRAPTLLAESVKAQSIVSVLLFMLGGILGSASYEWISAGFAVILLGLVMFLIRQGRLAFDYCLGYEWTLIPSALGVGATAWLMGFYTPGLQLAAVPFIAIAGGAALAWVLQAEIRDRMAAHFGAEA